MTAAFHTLGCKTNAYETQAVIEQFQEYGFETGDFSEKCDVYVINTCAVTGEAARKSRQIAGRCKKKNPDALVVLTGCYAQEAGEDLAKQAFADIIIGNGEKSRIAQIVAGRLGISGGIKETASGKAGKGADNSFLLISNLTHERRYEDQMISSQGDHVRAYVKIQDGCDRFCSYCIIPFLRGRSRSRKTADIISEVKTLASKGFQEVVLTGIDISSFQADENAEGDMSLAVLIRMISKVKGIERIRLGSLEAGIVSGQFISSMKEIKEFCPHFHLSLQSGCDSVLRRMNRHYDTKGFAGAAAKIREVFPEAAITTDVITGFPGETAEEFARTVQFVKDMKFSRLHVFPYSRREGTRADKMPDQIPKAVKEQRAKELIAVGEELKLDYESRFIGKPCRVLAEECISGENIFLSGYTREYVKVMIDTRKLPEASCPDAGEIKNLVNTELEVYPAGFIKGVLYT